MNAIPGTDFFKVTFIIVTLAVSNDGLTLAAVLFINETSPLTFPSSESHVCPQAKLNWKGVHVNTKITYNCGTVRGHY